MVQVALTIAGSDSGGGAGIQGDIKTFARFGVFGTSVVTGVTAQNTVGVTAWEPVSPGLVRAQIDVVMDDLRPVVVKTGMLGNAEIVRTVVERLRERRGDALIVDPVMVSTSGERLLDDDGVQLVRDTLLPLATLVTPNLDEASVLLGVPVVTEDDMQWAAEAIVLQLGAAAVLIKGGHGDGDEVTDVFYDGEIHVLRHDRVRSVHTHGTGCTLSAAITANLALGRSLMESVAIARGYVREAIATAPGLGGGRGPLNHWASGDVPTE